MSIFVTSSEPNSKVVFLLDPTAWHGRASESLWATEIGPGQYRLENTPFFAEGVSFADIVLARAEDERLLFVKAAIRGGHSTYRIRRNSKTNDEFETYWGPLQALGCTYEEGPGQLLAVDVPPKSNIFEVYAALESGEVHGIWTFEEGHCGHAVG